MQINVPFALFCTILYIPMNVFKTKYKLINSSVDTLPFIKHSNDAVSIDMNLKMKEANYNINHIKAVSSSKYINLSVNRLTGKGVNKENKIWNSHDIIKESDDVVTGFGKLNKVYKRRLFKKDNIVYDLLN
tara:strand:- start:113 stop:505 length:393 start_codon:yes stop_codon:yes gene_type:complete